MRNESTHSFRLESLAHPWPRARSMAAGPVGPGTCLAFVLAQFGLIGLNYYVTPPAGNCSATDLEPPVVVTGTPGWKVALLALGAFLAGFGFAALAACCVAASVFGLGFFGGATAGAIVGRQWGRAVVDKKEEDESDLSGLIDTYGSEARGSHSDPLHNW